MKLEFAKANWGVKAWAIQDDVILIKNKEIPLSSIYKLEYNLSSNPLLNNITFDYNNKHEIVFFSSRDRITLENSVKAYVYMLSNSRDANTFEVQEEIKKFTQEKRMKCNVCNQIFCFSYVDILKSEATREGMNNTNSSLTNAIGQANMNLTAMKLDQMQHKSLEKEVINFDLCPNCGSKNIEEISSENLNNNDKTDVASEIKKFKELLDMGAITQEEFDKKKKELLK